MADITGNNGTPVITLHINETLGCADDNMFLIIVIISPFLSEKYRTYTKYFEKKAGPGKQ